MTSDPLGTLAQDAPERQRSPEKPGHVCVCYVLSYRAPDYIRTRTLLAALNSCTSLRVVVATNTRKGIWRYVETLWRLARVCAKERPDAYVLGFRGHEIFWFVRAMIGKRPLIMDALMSPYAAMRDENKFGLFGRLLAPLVFCLEAGVLRRSDVLLTDTRLHAAYYARTFGIREARIVTVPVGAIEDKEPKQIERRSEAVGDFNVLFYGSFLALHGVDVIVRAAAQLKDLPVHFKFIGGSAIHERYLRKQCEVMGVTRYSYRKWVPFDRMLSEEIPAADLCLGGPFGATPQASRVVTGKAMQCLALSKATVVGKIAEDFGLVDRKNCLMVEQNDPAGLSCTIRWAFAHRELLGDIGQAGRVLYGDRLSVRIISQRLAEAFRIAGLGNIG